MGKTKYSRAKDFIEKIRESQGQIISFESFKNQVILCLGADEERTVKPYLRLMIDTNMIMEKGGQIVII